MLALSPERSNHRWALSANLFQAVISWLLLFILIRFGDKEDVGLYSYIQALILPVQLFFTLKLRVIQCSDTLNEYDAAEYHKVRFVSALLNCIIGALVLTVIADDNEIYLGGLFLLVSYSVFILRESYISIFQKNNNNKAFFLINFSGGFLSILSFFVTFLIFKEILISLFSLMTARVVSYFWIEKYVFKFNSSGVKINFIHGFNVDKSTIKILKSAWPLGLTAMLGALFTSIPKFTIKSEMGYEYLAVYASVTSLLVAFNLLVNSFVQSALPSLAKDYKKNLSEFFSKIRSVILKISILSLISAVGAYFIGEYFLWLLFGAEYRSYVDELVLVVMCGFSLSLFSISNLMLSSQRTFFAQFPIYLICCILIFGFSLIGVKLYGVAGALAAQSLGYFFGFIISLWIFNTRKG